METKPSSSTPTLPDIPFVNEMRLNWRLWLVTTAILVAAILLTPRVWKRVEKFEVGPDYRIPYTLSKDYWLYQRRLKETTTKDNILVLGDSVIWGEYVSPNGTLTHFLNEQTKGDRFVNIGVNGLYPLAIEGLVNHYADLHDRKVILHCNVLWMSSPKADLQDPKPQSINHSRLVPQFEKIPSYKADANERLSVLVERNVQFMSWVTHLQTAYFNDKSIPAWTLQSDDKDRYPNSYKNPLSQISLRVPQALADDPQRGPKSARHRPWTETGATPTTFEWLTTTNSLQWAAFVQTVGKLLAQHNDVVVIVGPFNEHMIAADNKPAFEAVRNGIIGFLKEHPAKFIAPEVLPSELYADGSHPLTRGYEELAERVLPEITKFWPDLKR
jgi:lysophospholipase L1-like esterase